MATFIGTAGDDSIEGTFSDDLIRGLIGNDYLTGGFGSDTIYGGEGDDRIYGSPESDPNPGSDILSGGAGNDYITSYSGPAHINGGAGDDSLTARAPGLIFGGDGNDTIDSVGGTIQAGSGSDRVDLTLPMVGLVATTINMGTDDDRLHVRDDSSVRAITFDLREGAQGSGRTIGVSGSETFSYKGNSRNITVIDDESESRIYIWSGEESPIPSAGFPSVTLDLGGGNDEVEINGGYSIKAGMGPGDDELEIFAPRGGIINAGMGLDAVTIKLDAYLHGPASEPGILGGPFVIDTRPNATSGAVNALAVKNAEGIGVYGWDGANNPQGSDYGWVHFYGGDTANYLSVYGTNLKAKMGAADDGVFFGRDVGNVDIRMGAGNDTVGLVDQFHEITGLPHGIVRGEAGDDLIWIEDFSGQVNGGAGDDTIRISNSFPSNLDIDIYGGLGDDRLSAEGTADVMLDGGAGSDLLDGRAGNDILNGGTGADTMIGRGGNDVYWVDHAGDRVDEATAYGTDRINSTISLDLDRAGGVYANVEDVALRGAGSINAYGSDADNTLRGNGGNNKLFGRVGNDTLHGGAGNDDLAGGTGNDVLSGGTGADKMTGVTGDDVYWVDHAGDRVIETATGGVDRINSTISLDLNRAGGVYANVEHVALQGNANLYAKGSAGDNSLFGNAGANTLNGQAGNDVLSGGRGADSFIYRDNYDQDTIVDFQNNVDTIHVLGIAGVTTFAQARSFATQTGDDVVFDFGGGDTLTISDTTINALSDDMVFV